MLENHPEPISPPVTDLQWKDWFSVEAHNPVIKYLRENLHRNSDISDPWEAARLSGAAYLYRNINTKWTVLAKHYTEKTGKAAEKYSEREFKMTKKALSMGLSEGEIRAVKPLGTFRGILFLEYVDGLTLEDLIAVRRSRPGTLIPGIEYSAKLLATLHSNSIQKNEKPEFESSLLKVQNLLDNLSRYGVLKGEPVIYGSLMKILNKWKEYEFMKDFLPANIHGDATASNFIFPWSGGVVAIDWERFYTGDPARDVGRLTAEIFHSITRHGGSTEEAIPVAAHFKKTYCNSLSGESNCALLLKRTKFFQALSTLRIARNGWLSRLERTSLVTQATVLLAV